MDPQSNESEPSAALIDGSPESDRDEIDQMYSAALGEKLRVALSQTENAIGMMEEYIGPNHEIISRAVDGQLLGVAGYKASAGSFMAMNLARLRRRFGIVGAIWRGSVLSLLVRQPVAGTLLMDGTFVAERARGRGVGTLLLSAVERTAEQQRVAQVRLEVIDTNPRARQPTSAKASGPLQFTTSDRCDA